jgi:hypothetical protein
MLQTYEATLEPNGYIWFTDFAKPAMQNKQKVLVTIVSSIIDDTADSEQKVDQIKPLIPSSGVKFDWQPFAGALKTAAGFDSDPLQIQQTLRDEWR